MIYKYTSDNITSLMQNVGELEERQIVRFFTGEAAPILTKTILDQLVCQTLVKYNPETGIYRFMGAAPFTNEISERRRFAFWAIANSGSKQVHTILPGLYPTQFTVIKSDSECFDLTVVESRDDAMAAAIVREHSIIKGNTDDVNHIAVLRRAGDKKYLAGLGFDYYCTVDPMTFRCEYTSVN